MKVVNRSEIEVEDYQEIFKKESHHNHEIIETKDGVLRWKKNSAVRFLVDFGNLNDIVAELYRKGHNRNSELHRKLYRDMGYSLSGYWEIFYWDWNNEDADSYEPTAE